MLKYLFLILLFPATLFSQEMSGGVRELLDVPVLQDPGLAKKIEPNQTFCFDKKIHIKTNGGSRASETYLYINTKDGYFATRTGRLGTLGNGEIDINDEKFTLTVYSKKGQAYGYNNKIKNKKLVHYVGTRLTDAFALQPVTPDNKPIFYKNEQATLCDGKFKTRVYKSEGDAVAINVYGLDFYNAVIFPNSIVIKDMLMYSGIGYFLSADNKVYVSAKMSTNSGIGFEAKIWENVDACFNASQFVKSEENAFNKMEGGINKQEEKLKNKTYEGSCIAEKQKVDAKKLELLEKQKRSAEKAKTSGNLYEMTPATMNAMSGMIDFVGNLEVSMLELDVKICQAELAKQKASDNGSVSGAENAANKIMCYNSKKDKIQQGINKLQQIETQFAGNPGKAMQEKMKAYGVIQRDVSAINCK